MLAAAVDTGFASRHSGSETSNSELSIHQDMLRQLGFTLDDLFALLPLAKYLLLVSLSATRRNCPNQLIC